MITPKEFLQKQKEINSAITQDDILYANELEKYIDDVISSKFDTFNTEIYIEASYIEGRYHPVTKSMTSFSATKSARIRKEITSRYEKNGWKIKTETLGEGSMNEMDYYVFAAK